MQVQTLHTATFKNGSAPTEIGTRTCIKINQVVTSLRSEKKVSESFDEGVAATTHVLTLLHYDRAPTPVNPDIPSGCIHIWSTSASPEGV